MWSLNSSHLPVLSELDSGLMGRSLLHLAFSAFIYPTPSPPLSFSYIVTNPHIPQEGAQVVGFLFHFSRAGSCREVTLPWAAWAGIWEVRVQFLPL